MKNYKLQGEFLKHNGRLPKDKNELARFVLFGIKPNKKNK